MQVETYEVLTFDVAADGSLVNEQVSEESLALISALGLEGQQELVSTKEVGGEEVQTRNPYRLLTNEERNIFATLFPVKTRIESYKGDAIPLRVLQVAAHAKSLGMVLYVLHPETNPRANDPVLIGQIETPVQHSWGALKEVQQYLLARWADALDSLDTLREKAIPKLAAQLRNQTTVAINKLKMVNENAEALASQYLYGEAVEIPSFVSINLPTIRPF